MCLSWFGAFTGVAVKAHALTGPRAVPSGAPGTSESWREMPARLQRLSATFTPCDEARFPVRAPLRFGTKPKARLSQLPQLDEAVPNTRPALVGADLCHRHRPDRGRRGHADPENGAAGGADVWNHDVWVVLLHIPRALTDLDDIGETSGVFEALALSGAAFILSDQRRSVARHAGNRPSRSSNKPEGPVLLEREE